MLDLTPLNLIHPRRQTTITHFRIPNTNDSEWGGDIEAHEGEVLYSRVANRLPCQDQRAASKAVWKSRFRKRGHGERPRSVSVDEQTAIALESLGNFVTAVPCCHFGPALSVVACSAEMRFLHELSGFSFVPWVETSCTQFHTDIDVHLRSKPNHDRLPGRRSRSKIPTSSEGRLAEAVSPLSSPPLRPVAFWSSFLSDDQRASNLGW